MLRASWPSAVLLLSAASLVGCAKQRETPKPTAAPMVKPAASTACRFESATASAELTVDVLSLDVPASEVRRVLTCAQGPLAECAGTLGKEKVASGEISAVVSLDKRGLVEGVRLTTAKGAAPSAEMSSCVSAVLRRLTFPAAEAGTAELRISLAYEPRPLEDLLKSPRFAGATVKLSAFAASEGVLLGLPPVSEAIQRRARSCYLLALEGAEQTKGTIAFDVRLSSAGVDDVKLTPNGTMQPDFIRCLDTVVRNTTYELPRTPAKLHGELVFAKAP